MPIYDSVPTLKKYMQRSEGFTLNNGHFDLGDVEKDCWHRLVNGANKSRDPFHTPCIASLNNGEVNMRTVVLRKALPTERALRFHTDIRSPKWNDLTINPCISALFYDASERIQLRIKGISVLHHLDPITQEAWQKTTLSSRRCYLSEVGPSRFSDKPTSGITPQIEQENFSLEESELGLQNFGIVTIQVQSMEWLWLNHAGHRRAYFDYANDENHWLIP